MKAARPVWGWGRGAIPRPTPPVDRTNITTQGFGWRNLDLPKVEAVRRTVEGIEPGAEIELVHDRLRPQHSVGDAVFCCVDSITTRAVIWRSVNDRCRFWSDGRMLGEVIRVVTVAENAGRDHYPTTLFAAADVQPGRCTARSTIYAASIAAGLMVHQFSRWLRGMPTDSDLTMNLLASEIAVSR